MKQQELLAWIKQQYSRYHWKVLVFLVLVLNVKLVVKMAALLLFTILEREWLSFAAIPRRRHLYFYVGMIMIGLVNVMLQYKTIHLPYLLVAGMGIMFWILSLAAAYHSFQLVQKADKEKLNNSLTLFFLLHILLVFFHLLMIMWETGTVNPYTFKGFHQKYYLSTGDSIAGITFDSPVTTATFCAFGLLYFLYRQRYFFSILCMAALLAIVSNLTNIFLLGALGIAFVFRSNRVQKSLIVVFAMMLVVFITKVSPQNNEYVVSFVYKLIGKAYYLPPVKVLTPAELKQTPDSLLSFEQRRIKTGLIYIDSVSSMVNNNREIQLGKKITVDTLLQNVPLTRGQRIFNEYRPTAAVETKEALLGTFLTDHYTDKERDSLRALYDWEKPGKAIGYKQVLQFLKNNPSKIVLGAGIGNFSSRAAFKATSLGIAGTYPEKFQYIHPDFLHNHLFIFLNYHSQWQIKHTAANTPDSVYGQLLSEYGLAGFLVFLIFFAGYYLSRARRLSYGLPLLCLLAGTFFVEYWFEQLSVVILFELLMFVDIRSSYKEETIK